MSGINASSKRMPAHRSLSGVFRPLSGSTNKMLGETNKTLGETNKMLGETNKMLGETDKALGETDKTLVETDRLLGTTDKTLGKTNELLGETDKLLETTDKMVFPTLFFRLTGIFCTRRTGYDSFHYKKMKYGIFSYSYLSFFTDYSGRKCAGVNYLLTFNGIEYKK